MIESKQCSRCKKTLDASFFYASKVLKSGLRSKCKSCELDGAAEKARVWYEANTERARESRKRYASENKDLINKAGRAWREENKERSLAIKRSYRERNRDRLNAEARDRRSIDPSRRAAASAKYDAKNRDVIRAKTASRRGRVCAASVPFDAELDILVMQEAHRLSRLRGLATGIDWHVDHIEPVVSDEVCGLHNSYNLQVIPAISNRRKSNKRIDAHWTRWAI